MKQGVSVLDASCFFYKFYLTKPNFCCRSKCKQRVNIQNGLLTKFVGGGVKCIRISLLKCRLKKMIYKGEKTMKNMTGKILLAFVLMLLTVAVFAVSVSAFDINQDLPSGVQYNEDGWVDSGYADVDKADSGYYLVGKSTYDDSTTATSYPKFASIDNTRFYWNKKSMKAVWIVTGDLAGGSGDADEKSTVNLKAGSTFDKQLWALAAAFVDVTNRDTNEFKTAFTGENPELVHSKYIHQGDESYPLLDAYTSAGTAGIIWESIHVTKDAYEEFIKHKESLSLTGDELNTELVSYARTYVAPYRKSANVLETGAKFNMAWVFKQLEKNDLSFDSIEFRLDKGLNSATWNTIGLATKNVLIAEKILFDSRIDKLKFTNNFRGFMIGNTALKTFAHVEYNSDMSGGYTNNFEEGIVDLTGFKTVTKYLKDNADDKAYDFYVSSELLYGSAVENVLYFDSIGDGTDDYSGFIDYRAFYDATSLETLTLTSPLTDIRKYAFYNCTSLTTIDLKGGIAGGATIDVNAFTNCSQTITVKVYNTADYMAAYDAFLGFGNINIVIDDSFTSVVTNPIIANGFAIRKWEYNGLRSLFTIQNSIINDNIAKGLTLADYGVITFSSNTLKKIYGGDINAVLASVVAGTNDAATVIVRSVQQANTFTQVNKETGDKQFALTITNVPEAYYHSTVYSIAYSSWADESGEVIDFTQTIYSSADGTGKNAYSLYDMTVGAFAKGVVNTETVTDEDGKVWQCCLWDVLSTGAVSYEEAQASGATYDKDNKEQHDSLYLDNPLYAFSNYITYGKNKGSMTYEETPSTNVKWSLIKNGSNYIAVYRDAGGEGESLLPGGHDQWGTGSTPFGCQMHSRTDMPTPPLTWNSSAKVTTIVIDYGVDGVAFNGDGALAGNNFATTIVYPNGFDEIDHARRDYNKETGEWDYYVVTDKSGNIIQEAKDNDLYNGEVNQCIVSLFEDNPQLTDIIWANNDEYGHMEDFNIAQGDTPMQHLFDLRGMGAWSSNQRIFQDTPLVENVVFGAAPVRAIYDGVFSYCTNIQRAWTVVNSTPSTKYDAPMSKTIDLSASGTTWGNFQGKTLNVKSDGYTLIVGSGTANEIVLNGYNLFGASESAVNFKIKVMVVNNAGEPVDPSTPMGKISDQYTAWDDSQKKNVTYDYSVKDRVFFYQPTGTNADRYVNVNGDIFPE